MFGLLFGVGKDFMRGLDDLEFGIDFLLSSRVAVRMVFESYVPC